MENKEQKPKKKINKFLLILLILVIIIISVVAYFQIRGKIYADNDNKVIQSIELFKENNDTEALIEALEKDLDYGKLYNAKIVNGTVEVKLTDYFDKELNPLNVPQVTTYYNELIRVLDKFDVKYDSITDRGVKGPTHIYVQGQKYEYLNSLTTNDGTLVNVLTTLTETGPVYVPLKDINLMGE